MDAKEAREHLEMVDRILANADERQSFHPLPSLLLWFGAGAALVDAGLQSSMDGGGNALAIAGTGVVLAGYVYLAYLISAWRRCADRVSRVSQQKSRFIGAVWLCIFVAAFAQPHVFTGWSAAAIWSIGAAIQMMVFAFGGDRRALVATVVLLASIVASNFVSAHATGYVLAAGFVFGYCAPGLVYALDRNE